MTGSKSKSKSNSSTPTTTPPSATASSSSSSSSTSTCPSSTSSSSSSMFHSLEELAGFCAFVVHKLFDTAEGSAPPPPTASTSSQSNEAEVPRLANFIRYALYRTRLNDQIAFQALFLLHRLKRRYPSARGTNSSPHRLFLAALMLASKILLDDTYSNRSWAVVGQSMFTLREVNCMERELFAYLDFRLVVSPDRLDAFVHDWASKWARRTSPGPLSSSSLRSSPNTTPHSSSSSSSETFSPHLQHRGSSSSSGVKRRLSVSAATFTPVQERHRDKLAALAAHSLLRPASHPLVLGSHSSSSHQPSLHRRHPVTPFTTTAADRPRLEDWPHTSSGSSECPSPDYGHHTGSSSSSSSSEIATPVMDLASPAKAPPFVDMDLDTCRPSSSSSNGSSAFEMPGADELRANAIKSLYKSSSYIHPRWAAAM